MKMLQNAPTFEKLYPQFYDITSKKTVLVYNANFDFRLISQTMVQDGGGSARLDIKGICMMLVYSVFVGEWSKFHDNWKLQPLPGGDHTALGDCRATLELIKDGCNGKVR